MFNPVFDSPFYPDMFGNNTQADLRKHKVWPLIVTLKMEFNLYLQSLRKPVAGGTKYLLCDGTGFRQAVLSINDKEEITLAVAKHSGFTISEEQDEVLFSKNVKYMLSKISKFKEDGSSSLYSVLNRGERQFGQYMQEMVLGLLMFWGENEGRSRYAPNMDVSLRLKCLKILNGSLSKNDLSATECISVERELRNMEERQEKHVQYRERIYNYLRGPKFMFMYDTPPMSSLLFGGIEFTNIEEMVDHTYELDGAWYSGPEVKFKINNGFRRLKVLSSDNGSVLPALPEELRDVVMSTLHLDKMNRSSKQLFHSQDPLFPAAKTGHVPFIDSPSFCWKGNSMSNFFFTSDKRGLLI